MKKLISWMLILLLLLYGTACSQQTPVSEETVPSLPEGNYVMIPIDPNAVQAIQSGQEYMLEGTYLTNISQSGEAYAIVFIENGDDPHKGGTLMNTSSGDKVLMFKDGNHYSFEKDFTKIKSCYAEDDTLLWEMTIHATFRYDGKTVSCTDVSGEIYVAAANSWYVISEATASDGNTASYTVEFGRSALGVTTSSSSYTITVSCDENGNLV